MRSLATTVALVMLTAACRTPLPSPVETAPKKVWDDYDALLHEVVDRDGYVDYDKLEANREPLDGVVRYFAERRLMGSSDARGAIWLNAYNAFVMFAVLEEGRPESVKKVDGWLPVEGAGFFLERSFEIDANEYTLWEVEHERIRLRRLDYRVHAALNCASMSCPPLRAEIYTGDMLDAQLYSQMRTWVNDPDRGIRVDGDKVIFSPLFQWYADDFSRWSGGQSTCELTAQFAEPELRAALQEHDRQGCPIEVFEYDWRLNQSPHSN